MTLAAIDHFRTQFRPPDRPDVAATLRGSRASSAASAVQRNASSSRRRPSASGCPTSRPRSTRRCSIAPHPRRRPDARRRKPAAPRAVGALQPREDAGRAQRIRRRRARPCARPREHLGHRGVPAGRPRQHSAACTIPRSRSTSRSTCQHRGACARCRKARPTLASVPRRRCRRQRTPEPCPTGTTGSRAHRAGRHTRCAPRGPIDFEATRWSTTTSGCTPTARSTSRCTPGRARSRPHHASCAST